MTPLHLAMAENIDPFIISRLLLENPKALRIKDKYGRTPLEQFFKMWKSHLLRRQTQNHSEWTKKRIVTKDSIQAIIQVLSHGKLDKLQSDEWLPIHEAIKLRNIIHPIFIKPLISQFPKELQRKDPDKQNLPLHVAAAQNSANTDLWMQVLLQEYPGAATVRNKSGRLPFNLMVESGKEWKKSTGWTKLIEAAPGAISMKDNKTKLYPFMAACACTETSLDVAYRLLKQDPTQVTGGILSNNKK